MSFVKFKGQEIAFRITVNFWPFFRCRLSSYVTLALLASWPLKSNEGFFFIFFLRQWPFQDYHTTSVKELSALSKWTSKAALHQRLSKLES